MNYRAVKSGDLKGFLKVLIFFTVIISILTITPMAAASDLDEFEEAATSTKTKQGSDDEDDDKDKEDEDDGVYQSLSEDDDDESFLGFIFGDFIEVIVDVFFSEIGQGAKMSLARVNEDMETDTGEVEVRRTGDPSLPFFQYEHKYLKISSDIDARENGLELGYGPFGFSCSQTDFREENPRDELSLTHYHLLLRISRKSSREIGLGLGSLVMDGNDDNSGLSITFPIKVYPSDSLGVRFKPTYSWINGNSIDEYDLSLAYTIRYASIQLGYRFIEAGGVDLNGSYLGFAVHY